MKRRLLALVPFAVLSTVVACSSKDGDEVGPAPTDPVVYDATPETKADTGIAKWGYGEVDGVTTFHGYDDKNKELVEVRQHIDQTEDIFTQRVTIAMTGAFGTGVAEIQLGMEVDDDLKVTNTEDTIQNTIKGSSGEKVLAHLGTDADSMSKKAIETDTSVALFTSTPIVNPQSNSQLHTTGIHPTDLTNNNGAPLIGDAGALTDGGSNDLIQCCCDLNTQTAGLSGQVASQCALNSGGQQQLNNKSFRIKAIVKGPNGGVQVQSPWQGPYNIADHHCHHAASQNVSSSNGYIGCNSQSSTTTWAGHTINWGPNPNGGTNNTCAYEPQANGGTEANGAVCCFPSSSGGNGAPALSSAQAQSCVSKLCQGQASNPQAFPPGQTPPIPNNCPGSTNTLSNCNACCTTILNDSTKFNNDPKDGPKYQQQNQDFAKRCAANCQQAETVRKPAPGQCNPAVQQQQQSQNQKQQQCGSGNNPNGSKK